MRLHDGYEVDIPLLCTNDIQMKTPFYGANHFCPFANVKELKSSSKIE